VPGLFVTGNLYRPHPCGGRFETCPTGKCPDVRSIYALFGAEDRLRCVQFQAGHNYNRASRETMYACMGRWLLGIADAQRLREKPFRVEQATRLRVWAGRRRPARALDEPRLAEYLIRLRGRCRGRSPDRPAGGGRAGMEPGPYGRT